ncbi:hypothetical protein NQZ68_006219 [Dissostichus eleginoides]|nr:hypothetical protein NQZ68_006219 [Dissostichus eleginoides]
MDQCVYLHSNPSSSHKLALNKEPDQREADSAQTQWQLTSEKPTSLQMIQQILNHKSSQATKRKKEAAVPEDPP